MQLKGLMPKQWSNTAVYFSVAPLISHGLIPNGKWFLLCLPPSPLRKRGVGTWEYPSGPPPCSPPFRANKQPGTWAQLAHLFTPSQPKAGDNIGAAPTFTSVSHCPVTITAEHKATLETPISGLPNHTATRPNLLLLKTQL